MTELQQGRNTLTCGRYVFIPGFLCDTLFVLVEYIRVWEGAVIQQHGTPEKEGLHSRRRVRSAMADFEILA